ncbi:MAG: hypothetical protein GY778_30615, partial [bacterium]|nr:hypothetical protein [bacterium]
MGGQFHPEWPECLPSICHENGPPCPPEGSDQFADTHAAFIMDIPGIGPRPIVANGPTTVRRAQPEFLPDGGCYIETEIVELSLVGLFDPGAACPGSPTQPSIVTVDLDPSLPTRGAIVSSAAGGQPDYPDDSQFNVNVIVSIHGVGTYEHTVDLGNTLTRADLWSDPPCVDPEGPYVPPSNDHAHIPCPPGDPPTGCCILPAAIGDGCFETYEQICELLGGTYLGDGVPCPTSPPAACCFPGRVCQVLFEEECAASGGEFHPDWPVC